MRIAPKPSVELAGAYSGLDNPCLRVEGDGQVAFKHVQKILKPNIATITMVKIVPDRVRIIDVLLEYIIGAQVEEDVDTGGIVFMTVAYDARSIPRAPTQW